MNDPNLDKAATRIQASYRGYKTRKELVSAGSQDQQQQPTSPRTHDDYDNAQTKSKIIIFYLFIIIFYFYDHQLKVIKKAKKMIVQQLLKFK